MKLYSNSICKFINTILLGKSITNKNLLVLTPEEYGPIFIIKCGAEFYLLYTLI